MSSESGEAVTLQHPQDRTPVSWGVPEAPGRLANKSAGLRGDPGIGRECQGDGGSGNPGGIGHPRLGDMPGDEPVRDPLARPPEVDAHLVGPPACIRHEVGVRQREPRCRSRQAAITQEQTEERDLCVGESVDSEHVEPARHGDRVAGGERSQLPPSIEREERMVLGGEDLPPEAGPQPEHRPDAVVESIGWRHRLEPSGGPVVGGHV